MPLGMRYPLACGFMGLLLQELSLAGNQLNPEAARIFSEGTHDNGALASLKLSGNRTGQGKETKAAMASLGVSSIEV